MKEKKKFPPKRKEKGKQYLRQVRLVYTQIRFGRSSQCIRRFILAGQANVYVDSFWQVRLVSYGNSEEDSVSVIGGYNHFKHLISFPKRRDREVQQQPLLEAIKSVQKSCIYTAIECIRHDCARTHNEPCYDQRLRNALAKSCVLTKERARDEQSVFA